ncbi:MAG: hypothetical protein OXI79_03350 [Gammaproteobacteria bacterium]|nr:hypothetical protein [Gammaproteobacteria bacterium]
MEFEALVPNVPYVASVVVVGLFLWRVFVRMLAGIEGRFQQIDDRFKHLDDRFNQIDRRFEEMNGRFVHMDHRFEETNRRFDDRFASLDKKVDCLADDHHGLSRELSEFRGEMRGRLSMLVPQAADA